MKSAVETLSPTRAKLTVEVPFEELKPSLDAAYKKIAQQINVPGLPQGQGPADGHRPAGRPRRRARRGDQRGAAASCTSRRCRPTSSSRWRSPRSTSPSSRTTRPSSSPPRSTSVPRSSCPTTPASRSTVDDVAVTDQDVEEQVQSAARALRQPHRGRARRRRRRLRGRWTWSPRKDGEVVEGAEVSGMSYQVGKGGMLDGLDEALTGLSAGDETTFTSQLVGGDQLGEDVEVEVKVSSVKEQELPELDDDFAQTASEFDTVAELTDDVRTRLARGKRLEQAAAARDAVLEKLLDLVDVPLPEARRRVRAHRPPRADRAAARRIAGMTMEAVPRLRGADRRRVRGRPREAGPRRRRRPVRARPGRQGGGDRRQRGRAPGAPDAPRAAVRPEPAGVHPAHGRAQPHPGDGVRGRARQGAGPIVEAATVTDESGNHVELKNLQPDGTHRATRPRPRPPRLPSRTGRTTRSPRRRRGHGGRLSVPQHPRRPVPRPGGAGR